MISVEAVRVTFRARGCLWVENAYILPLEGAVGFEVSVDLLRWRGLRRTDGTSIL
jgi:hypothetical protein